MTSREQSKPANRLFDLFFAAPEFRQMYLRRLRTLMDTMLMPSGTPTNAAVIEPHHPPVRKPDEPDQHHSVRRGPGLRDLGADLGQHQFEHDAHGGRADHLRAICRAARSFSTTAPMPRSMAIPIPAAQPTNAVVYIASWDYNPVSGNPAEQYVELAQHQFLRRGRVRAGG